VCCGLFWTDKVKKVFFESYTKQKASYVLKSTF